jgi:hypothetical protein
MMGRMHTPAIGAAFLLGFAACALLLPSAQAAGLEAVYGAAPEPEQGQIAILYPTDGSTVFDNNGEVGVQIALSPRPGFPSGGRIELFLDGRPVPLRGGAIALAGIDRGWHRLEARIVAADGSIAAKAEPVNFYMWQASRLFPTRR